VRRGEGEQRGRVDGGGGEVEVEGQRGVLGHRVRAVGVGVGIHRRHCCCGGWGRGMGSAFRKVLVERSK
jgi:hypothetical protein